MQPQTLTLPDLADLLNVPASWMRAAIDRGQLPPGVEAVERSPGGHRRVIYRPAPPVVFCDAAVLRPAKVTTVAPWHRPWQDIVDEVKAVRVHELVSEAKAELVVINDTLGERHLLSGVFRHVGRAPIEIGTSWSVGRDFRTAAQLWLDNEAGARWPRKASVVTPALEPEEFARA